MSDNVNRQPATPDQPMIQRFSDPALWPGAPSRSRGRLRATLDGRRSCIHDGARGRASGALWVRLIRLRVESGVRWVRRVWWWRCWYVDMGRLDRGDLGCGVSESCGCVVIGGAAWGCSPQRDHDTDIRVAVRRRRAGISLEGDFLTVEVELSNSFILVWCALCAHAFIHLAIGPRV